MKELQSFKLPYGQGFIEFVLPKDKVQAVLSPKTFYCALSEKDIIINTLKNPINSPSLKDLVRGKTYFDNY